MSATPTAALWTPAGRGAIAVIRVAGVGENWDGARPVFQPANGLPWSAQPLRRVIFGRWGWSTPEDVVVCRLTADSFEVHCHGGSAAARRILADCARLGIVETAWTEQLAAAADFLEAELQSTLAAAPTVRTGDLLWEQSSGLLRETYAALQDAGAHSYAGDLLDHLLAWSDFGVHLSVPWSVVISGRPNVGKSTLINALLGYERAIVSAQAGTTRDVLTARTAFDGWPVELADTAGVRSSSDALESAGIARAAAQLSAADLPIVLLDVSQPPQEEDQRLLAAWPNAIVVANKSDLSDRWGAALPETALRVSAQTGAGLAELQAALVRRLVPQIPDSGTPIPVTRRQTMCLQAARAAWGAQDAAAYDKAIEALFFSSEPRP